VKFLIEDLVAMRQRLVARGATLTTPRTYEENLLFDTPDAQLRHRQCGGFFFPSGFAGATERNS